MTNAVKTYLNTIYEQKSCYDKWQKGGIDAKINYARFVDAAVKLAVDYNSADLKTVLTEADAMRAQVGRLTSMNAAMEKKIASMTAKDTMKSGTGKEAKVKTAVVLDEAE